MEVVSFWVVESHVLCTIPVIFKDSPACAAVKDMNCLARVPDDVLGVLVDESAITIRCRSPLSAFKPRCAILLEKGDFLSACEVAVVAHPYFHYKPLNGALEVRLIVGHTNPQFIFKVVHLRAT